MKITLKGQEYTVKMNGEIDERYIEVLETALNACFRVWKEIKTFDRTYHLEYDRKKIHCRINAEERVIDLLLLRELTQEEQDRELEMEEKWIPTTHNIEINRQTYPVRLHQYRKQLEIEEEEIPWALELAKAFFAKKDFGIYDFIVQDGDGNSLVAGFKQNSEDEIFFGIFCAFPTKVIEVDPIIENFTPTAHILEVNGESYPVRVRQSLKTPEIKEGDIPHILELIQDYAKKHSISMGDFLIEDGDMMLFAELKEDDGETYMDLLTYAKTQELMVDPEKVNIETSYEDCIVSINSYDDTKLIRFDTIKYDETIKQKVLNSLNEYPVLIGHKRAFNVVIDDYIFLCWLRGGDNHISAMVSRIFKKDLYDKILNKDKNPEKA